MIDKDVSLAVPLAVLVDLCSKYMRGFTSGVKYFLRMPRSVLLLSGFVAMAAVWQLYRPVLSSLVPWGKVAKASTAWITIDTAANAKSLARKLVESKLAA